MVNIEINNNKIKLTGNLKILNRLFNDMKVKHPNAFYLRRFMEPGWDGKIKYLTENGYAKTGLFPMVTSLLEKYKEQYNIKDRRNILEFNEIPEKIGEFIPREYQFEAVKSIVENRVGGIIFQRGIIGAATNAGKTLIAAMLYQSYKNSKALICVNNKDLYKQFIDDMPKMFGNDWGYMQGKNVKWANIMVCMTPTLRNRLYEFSTKLSKFNMIIFDECHQITSKTNKKVLTALYNTEIRVGLSGTPFAHKNPINNMDVRAFFGEQTFVIKNVELIEMGFSTPIVIKIFKGNTKVIEKGDYDTEYRNGISISRERMDMSTKRINYYLDRGCYPILVVCRYHEHVDFVFNHLQSEFSDRYSIDFIHHKVRDRKEKLDKFKSGGTDILVASLIIKLGQNMPLIKYMQNLASGDSQINALQLIGRILRTHKSKNKVYYEDVWDKGFYLQRHSRHRINYYLKEKFKVIFLDKDIKDMYFRYKRKDT